MRVCTRHYSGTRGLYVKAIPDYKTVDYLKKILRASEPPFSVDEQNFHATVICSDLIPKSIYVTYPRIDISTKLVKAEHWFGQNGKGFAILRLRARPFLWLHRMYEKLGAYHIYKGGYIPHVTAGMEVGCCTEEINAWLFRINSAIHLHNPTVVFNRIRVRDVLF